MIQLATPARPCAEPGCPRLRPCALHPRKKPSGTAGYGRAWREGPRAQVITPDARCVDCGSPFRLEADHIDPKVDGGSDDPANLVPRCKSCHSRRTARMNRFRRRRV